MTDSDKFKDTVKRLLRTPPKPHEKKGEDKPEPKRPAKGGGEK